MKELWFRVRQALRLVSDRELRERWDRFIESELECMEAEMHKMSDTSECLKGLVGDKPEARGHGAGAEYQIMVDNTYIFCPRCGYARAHLEDVYLEGTDKIVGKAWYCDQCKLIFGNEGGVSRCGF